MALPYREFAVYTLSDLVIRENENDRITLRGNRIFAEYRISARSPAETPEQVTERVRRLRSSLPRHSDFSERLALAF